MPRLPTLSFAFLLLVSVGCDTADDASQIGEPPAEAFSLAFSRDDGDVVGPVSGTTRYELTGFGGTAGGNTLLGSATLRPSRIGGPSGTLAVYSTTGTADFPPPGRYDFALTSERPILIQLSVGGRDYSPYRGSVTIEEAGPTALRVRIDADMTTGGCALLPSTVCSGPTLTGHVLATVRAGADG